MNKGEGKKKRKKQHLSSLPLSRSGTE